ncbi:hypothetical protein GF389_03805 [Candidatus Dojkabacteria bacterium]|nr:hypothetical protein [Candidatus Dojkabacteria bacterium]
MNLLAAIGFLTLIFQPLFPAFLAKTPDLTEEGPVYLEGSIDDATLEARPETIPLETPSISADYTDIANEIAAIDLPLIEKDYYWGKYENAEAGVNELNAIDTLEPGDKISIIGNGYITLNPSRGYIQPQAGYYYGSGLCWSVSALGGAMDEANKTFKEKYGTDLFVFEGNYGSRYGHSHTYPTYGPSNNGYGYSIIKVSSGKGQVDYTFTLNPQIENIKGLENAKFRIELEATEKHPTAFKGQSIKATVYSNIK